MKRQYILAENKKLQIFRAYQFLALSMHFVGFGWIEDPIARNLILYFLGR